jgi:hypothetical protein
MILTVDSDYDVSIRLEPGARVCVDGVDYEAYPVEKHTQDGTGLGKCEECDIPSGELCYCMACRPEERQPEFSRVAFRRVLMGVDI